MLWKCIPLWFKPINRLQDLWVPNSLNNVHIFSKLWILLHSSIRNKMIESDFYIAIIVLEISDISIDKYRFFNYW